MTDEDEGKVEDYIEEHGIRYPIVIEESRRSRQQIGVSGIPNAVLVDPKGTIVWRGHPASFQEDALQEALRGARVPGVELPREIRSVQRKLDREQYGRAWTDLKRDLDGGRLEGEAETVARELVTRIEKEAADLYATATKALAEKDYYLAMMSLERLADAYEGVHEPEAVDEKLSELRSDSEVRKAVKAGEKLVQAQEYDRAKEYEKAYRSYQSIAKSYDGTRAGEIAAARADEIEQQGLRGFDKDCRVCSQQGSACPKHKIGR